MVVEEGNPQPMTIRMTQIYRNEDGEWRLVHRHGNFAPIDWEHREAGLTATSP